MVEPSLGSASGEVALSVEGLGDYFGRSRLRAALGFAVVRRTGPFQMSIVAGLRRPALAVEEPVHADLLRLGIDYHSSLLDISAGRVVTGDARGWLRLDGAHLMVRHSEAWNTAVWAGRLWTPESALWGYQKMPLLEETFVAGTQLQLEPPSAGSWRGSFALGAEGRTASGELGFRLFGAASAADLRGSVASALVEVGQVADAKAGIRLVADGELPLGADLSAGLALRWEGSAQSTARSEFYEIVGTALPPGILEDRPTVELEELYRKKLASPDELVELRGLFYEGGALRGELFNGSDRVLNRAVLDVQVRDADGRASASRLVEVIPGPDRRALGAGASKAFLIDLSGEGGAPAGIGGARVETLVWAE